MIKQWVKTNFKDALIIALLIILLVKVFGHGGSVEPSITVVRDTVYVIHDSTVYSKPSIYTSIAPKPKDIPSIMLPDTNYYKLKAQYESLLVSNYTKNVYKDTLKVDSIGQVRIEDTIQNNNILARRFDYNFRERIITNTVTITNPPKRQLYYGAEVGATQIGKVNIVGLGVLYKNRHEQMLGLSFGYNIEQTSPQYTLHYYQKLKLSSH